jgi:hypothetical protein
MKTIPRVEPAAERALTIEDRLPAGTVTCNGSADLAWVRLLAPRSPEEAAIAMRIAISSRHIWAFRLSLSPAERRRWYASWSSV